MNAKCTVRRCLLLALFAFSLAWLANTSRATVMSFTPSPADLYDLDHHYSYSWRIDSISLPTNAVIDSATLTFSNIANWDSTPNMLFGYLLDTATHSGVNTFQDHPFDEVPVGDITDHFANGAVIPSLITSSTAMTKLFQQSFTTTPTTYTFTFTAAELTTLTNYINNGNDVALGFDPECHFFNDGVTFCFDYVTPVPEMANAIPVFCLVGVAIGFELRRRRSAVKI